jgi:hypothetical protein
MSGGTQCGVTARLPIRARSRQRQERSRTRRCRGNAPAVLVQLATSPLRRCRRARRSVAAESSESAAVFLDGPSRVPVQALLERHLPGVPGSDRQEIVSVRPDPRRHAAQRTAALARDMKNLASASLITVSVWLKITLIAQKATCVSSWPIGVTAEHDKDHVTSSYGLVNYRPLCAFRWTRPAVVGYAA